MSEVPSSLARLDRGKGQHGLPREWYRFLRIGAEPVWGLREPHQPYLGRYGTRYEVAVNGAPSPGVAKRVDTLIVARNRIRNPEDTRNSAMNYATLQSRIEVLWNDRTSLSPSLPLADRRVIEEVLGLLDTGALRVAEPDGRDGWRVNLWLKQAVLLSFRIEDNALRATAGGSWDKVPPKWEGWDEVRFREAGFRAVPGSVARRSAFIAANVILMPSFVNVGAYVDTGTMVDTWTTVGSCAQIGRNCHLSGGVGIGGVLEPLQANPVIIEDDCFIGARSEVAEGVIVGRGSVLSMGVFLGASTKIVDRATGEVFVGRVPPYCVVVPGSLPGRPLPDGTPGPSLYCAVIVKQVDARTREKTSINDLLRD